MKRLFTRILWCTALVLAVTACGRDPTPEEQEQALRTRVAQWWTARQQRDHDTMYQLYDPAYRGRVDRAGFLKESLIRTRFDILSYEVQEVRLETPARARVRLSFTFLFPRAGGALPGRVEETWLMTEGKWFKEHQPITPPFPQPAGAGKQDGSKPSPSRDP
jgi:hypothetical protein